MIRAVVGVVLPTAGYAAGLPAWATLVMGLATVIAVAGAFGRCVVCRWVGLAPCQPASPEGDWYAGEGMNAARGRCDEAGGATVKCLRCAGLMVREQAAGLGNVDRPKSPHRWFCIRCGELADGVILPHRIDRWGPHPVVERFEEQGHG